jgi:hypothetical protein
MHTSTSGDRRWLDCLLLALEAGVVFSIPALGAYRNALSQTHLLWANDVNEMMKHYEAPVAVYCSITALLLAVTGVLEWRNRRHWRAVWDLGFAVLAMSWALLLYAGLSVKLK